VLVPPNLKLEEEKKKRFRSLDLWKTHYHPVPKDGGRGGKQEEEGLHQQESQIQSFLLHHIHHLQQQQQQPQPPSKKPSRLAGQIVPVQASRVVRSTGRKDRHSKVCTAKGLRDRRVRLSAHTAIQFYDVQDRLGYDRPSKAVDWLIKNSKAAIDQLDELPPWHPNTSTDFQEQPSAAEPVSTSTAAFLSPSLGPEANAESFFPAANSSSYPPDLLSRTSSQAQDLRLSLQSFQDHTPNMFSGSAHLAFDTNSVIPWNVADNSNSGGLGGFSFSQQPVLGQSQFYTQREPLQSSNSPSLRAWNDPVTAATGHHMHHSLFHSVQDISFGSSSLDFTGFHIPARIQGKEEHDGSISDKPDSASASHY